MANHDQNDITICKKLRENFMSTISKTRTGETIIQRREGAGQARRQAGLAPASYFRWKGPLDRCLAAACCSFPGCP